MPDKNTGTYSVNIKLSEQVRRERNYCEYEKYLGNSRYRDATTRSHRTNLDTESQKTLGEQKK